MRFPNPLTAVSDLVARAVAIVGDRDGADGRRPFGLELPHTWSHHPTRAPAPRPEMASSRDGAESSATSRTPLESPGEHQRP